MALATDSGLAIDSRWSCSVISIGRLLCFSQRARRRTKRDGAKPVLGGAWHGDLRPRAEADRGADHALRNESAMIVRAMVKGLAL